MIRHICHSFSNTVADFASFTITFLSTIQQTNKTQYLLIKKSPLFDIWVKTGQCFQWKYKNDGFIINCLLPLVTYPGAASGFQSRGSRASGRSCGVGRPLPTRGGVQSPENFYRPHSQKISVFVQISWVVLLGWGVWTHLPTAATVHTNVGKELSLMQYCVQCAKMQRGGAEQWCIVGSICHHPSLLTTDSKFIALWMYQHTVFVHESHNWTEDSFRFMDNRQQWHHVLHELCELILVHWYCSEDKQ